MAQGMNKVFLYGNLGADPEIKSFNGENRLKFRLATTERWRDRTTGDMKERTDWHNVVVWGKRAAPLGNLLHRGDRVMVEGEIRNSTYERDGRTHSYTEVRAREVHLAGSRRRREDVAVDDMRELRGRDVDFQTGAVPASPA